MAEIEPEVVAVVGSALDWKLLAVADAPFGDPLAEERRHVRLEGTLYMVVK